MGMKLTARRPRATGTLRSRTSATRAPAPSYSVNVDRRSEAPNSFWISPIFRRRRP
jgi:hypothetical protein